MVTAPAVPSLGSDELRALVTAIGAMPHSDNDHERIERVRQFERLKAAIAAAQAAETAAFAVSQRAEQDAQKVPVERQNRGIASQIALARSMSLHAAQRYVGFASILIRELPETLATLARGETSEWRATLLARETIFLSRADREALDRRFAPRLHQMSDRAVETQVRTAAYHLDPLASLARASRAITDRNVSIRPVPDTMVRLSMLAPVAQGVAAYAALSKAADTARSDGDARSRGQLMADTLIERVTGQASADAIAVEVELVVGTASLFATTSESRTAAPDAAAAPGMVTAPGLAPIPIPAGTARDLVAKASQAWLRRLFVRPETGELVALESHRRLFTQGQRDFIRFRDQHCATPYCGAPNRQADHIVPAARGGPTDTANARGLCEACNYAYEAPGWHSRPLPDGSIETITPTGHVYVQPPAKPFVEVVAADQSPEGSGALDDAA